jgi:2-keto-4-pentenoate hydratase/2-oxohepta-3-ene-1,7-dioic acid hydratase in catechol pathway
MFTRIVIAAGLLGTWIALAGGLESAARAADGKPTKYVRFQAGRTIAYGIVEGDNVRELSGDLFGAWKKTETTHSLAEVKVLVPCQPRQVFALAGNYRSHLGGPQTVTTTITTTTKIVTDTKTNKTDHTITTDSETIKSGEVPKKFQIPQIFYKSISSLAANGDPIVLPKDSKTVHYEAELVIVIGKETRKVSKDKALDYVLGVTCGNDVSERVWQKADVQWWRAKGSETFGPCGPYIASGINYDDLLVQLRLNGKEMQKERTSQFIQSVPEVVSFISQHVTLYPGDLIFTGTPGQTSEMKPGDVVEVEIEGVGVLRNPVVAEK